MKWDTEQKKSIFPSQQVVPYTWKERDRISNGMTIPQILQTSEYKVKTMLLLHHLSVIF
jgi:hypothetical protein